MNEGMNNRGGLKTAKEYGVTWTEREEGILKSLDEKLEIAREFSNIIDGLRNGKLGKKKAEILIAEMEHRLEQGLSVEVLEKYRQLIKLNEDCRTLLLELEKIEEIKKAQGNYDYVITPEFEEVSNRTDDISAEMIRIVKEYPSLDFIMTMKTALDHLKEALVTVERYKKEPDSILRDLAKMRMRDYEKLKAGLKIAQIVFTLTSVNIVLEKGETFEALYGKQHYDEDEDEYTVGLHIRGSFVHVIRDRGDNDVRATIKHEDEHVLTDAFDRQFLSLGPPASILNLAITFNNKEKENEIINNKTGRYGAPRLLNDSHYEIITALLESKKLINFLKSNVTKSLDFRNLSEEEKFLRAIFGEKVKPNKLSPSEIVDELLYLLHTAGVQIDEVVKVLNKGKASKNPKLSEICRETKYRYIKIFLRSMRSLGNAYLLADKFGKEAKKDTALLTYLLKPSQFHHIPQFLERKYDKK